MVQLGESDAEEKPRYAKLAPGQRMEAITLEEALDLFRLPRTLGNFEDKEVTVASGRFGPYVKHDNKFYSLSKQDDPYTVNLERAVEVILEKRQKEKERVIHIFAHDPEVKVLNGRYGPYIAMGKDNYKIPKDKVPANLTLEECLAIIEEEKKSGKPKRRAFSRSKTSDTKK